MGDESAEPPQKKHKSDATFDEDECAEKLKILKGHLKNVGRKNEAGNFYAFENFEKEVNVEELLNYMQQSKHEENVAGAANALGFASIRSSNMDEIAKQVPALINVESRKLKSRYAVLELLDKVLEQRKDKVCLATEESVSFFVGLLDRESVSFRRKIVLDMLVNVIDAPDNGLIKNFAVDADYPLLIRLLEHKSLTPEEKDRVVTAVAASWKSHVNSGSTTTPMNAKLAAVFGPVHAKVLNEFNIKFANLYDTVLRPACLVVKTCGADLVKEDPNIFEASNETTFKLADSKFAVYAAVLARMQKDDNTAV